MSKNDDRLKEVEFVKMLRENQLKTPNDFTIGMGQLIKAAREERGLSQTELAKSIKRRPATISEIENGKSEIGVLTLVLFSLELNKPITYFFPDTLLRDIIADVKTPFEHKMLEMAKGIEFFGNPKFTLDILGVMLDHFESDYQGAMNGYPPDDEEPDK
jgi:transcriptional regulator with XRE-family HTH domain